MAQTLALNMDYIFKAQVYLKGHLVVVEEEHHKAIEAQDIIETTRNEVEQQLEKVQEDRSCSLTGSCDIIGDIRGFLAT